jgi:gamma-glutamylcysteine synthetase
VRYLDAQPFWRIGEAVTTVTALLYDTQARRNALDLLLPRAGDQQRAWTEATTGFSPEAGALLSIARAAQHSRAAQHPRRPQHRRRANSARALALADGGVS